MSEEKSLVQIIDERKASIEYTVYTYDIDWFVQKIKKGAINISPEYQRSFEWDIGQQSRFIESLILNMPIPSIYMVENDEGTLELLDGLQRLSTILYFLNEVPDSMSDLRFKLNVKADERLNDNENDDEEEDSTLTYSDIEKLKNSRLSFQLKGCDIIEALNGKSYSDLEPKIQNRLMNKAITVFVYSNQGETNQDFKYHMFNRMNSGGTELSKQQQLNSKLRLIDSRFINFIGEIANSEVFFNFVKLFHTDIKTVHNKGMFKEEMVLRFIAMSFKSDEYRKDIAPFLEIVATEYTRRWKGLFNSEDIYEKQALEEKLKQVFEKLVSFSLGKETFNLNGKKNFNFVEAVVCHLIQHPEVLETLTKENYEKFQIQVTKLNPEKTTSPFSGGGKNTTRYFKQRLDIVGKAFTALNE